MFLITIFVFFGYRTRGFATGIAAGVNYFMAFIATKTYYNFENWFSLPGVTLLYGTIGALGFVAMYLILPETESRSLEEIELHFSDNQKKITDRKIIQTTPKKRIDSIETPTPIDEKASKGAYAISDIFEMTNGTPSVIGGVCSDITANNNETESSQNKQNGCDNKAFVMDR